MATQLENNTSTIETLIEAINALPEGITIDSTLTQEGKAADAKAVGEALTEHNSSINTLQNQTLKQSDRQGIISDALTALAGADPSNANAAVIETLNGRTGVLERKFSNMAEDIASLQQQLDEFEIYVVSRATLGWPVISPDGTLYGIKVRDDGTLYAGTYEEEV